MEHWDWQAADLFHMLYMTGSYSNWFW
jgi:hypothetical protein